MVTEHQAVARPIRALRLSVAPAAALIAGGELRAQINITPFTEEAVQRGLVYVMPNAVQPTGIYGYGCGFADLDNDGDQDIILMGGIGKPVGIYENDGTGYFIDRTQDNGIPMLTQPSTFAAGDYDGDGRVDLYFTQWSQPNVLVRNLGGFQFQDVTAAAGVANAGASKGAHWGDYNGDGWLDLYVCNYTGYNQNNVPNTLYRNTGNGSFIDVSVAQTVNDTGSTFQAAWFDMDRDGDLDLYICNDRGHVLNKPNQLWRNDNGQLVNISSGSGANLALFAMGLATGDFDGNGGVDFYITNISSYPQGFNPLLLNQNDRTFIEFSQPAGVDHWTTSWGAIFWDFDNNGTLDLYVNNQWFINTLYYNPGTFPCVNVTSQANVGGSYSPIPPLVKTSYCSAIADVNNDGALDLLLNNLGGNVELFINHEGLERNWVRYRLVGEFPNLHAVGANVDTRVGDTWQFREIYAPGNAYNSQHELIIHVGLGDAEHVDEAVVSWPGGRIKRTLTNLPANLTWTIYPPSRLGDANGDGEVDLSDFLAFAACFASPVAPGCEMMDFTGDSMIDLTDVDGFLAAYVASGRIIMDCNGNQVADLQDILLDPQLDANTNGIIDTCEPASACPADIDGNLAVNVADLLAVINDWGVTGPPGTIPADINGDGQVNVTDLLAVINAWGPCPEP